MTEINQNKGPGGAPPLNRNAYRHGLYSPSLPVFKGASYIHRQTLQYRRKVEDAVVTRDGDVSQFNAAVIAAAVEWLRHGLWASVESSNNYSKLTPEQKMLYRREIPRSFSEVVRLLKSIGLDRQPELNPVSLLYGSQANAN